MILIDTVYQKVLAITNKEQRGYVTPQEFNLFANQAQMEVFEQYFYDINQFNQLPKSEIEYSNINELIDEKLSIFKERASIASIQGGLQGGSVYTLPTGLYKMGVVTKDSNISEIHRVDQRELSYIISSPLTAPTVERCIYVLENTTSTEPQIIVYPVHFEDITVHYTRRPIDVTWGYTVVNEKPMYNSTITINFELHESETVELVYKILKLAGVALEKPQVMRAGQGLEMAQVSQEKQ